MKTKTNAKLLALALALVMTVLALASCTLDDFLNFRSPFDEGETCTVVVANGDETKEYKADLGKVEVKEGVFSVLEWLKSEGKLDFEAQDSAYGKFLTSVGDAKPQAANEFVLVMTSVEKDFDTSTYFKSIDYKGTKIGTSGLGASSMTVEAGAIYYFTVDSY